MIKQRAMGSCRTRLIAKDVVNANRINAIPVRVLMVIRLNWVRKN
jgi:hypothetical protein